MGSATSGWVTAETIAARHGLTERDVVGIARLVGVDRSRVHARWEAGRLSLSPSAAALVWREIECQAREKSRSGGTG